MSNEGVRRAGRPDSGSFFNPNDGEFMSIDTIVLADGTTLAASAAGPGVCLGDKGTARLTINVTAHTAGGDTIDVNIETSADNGVSDAWRVVGSFTQSVGVASERKSFSGLDRWVRYDATLVGAGVSVTFTISGDAV